MVFKFVYGIFPVLVSYKEVDKDVKNYASGCRIILQPKYKCDEGILQHELTHVRQWYRGGFFLHTQRYGHSTQYRLNCEIEAYRNQMKYTRCDGTFLSIEEAANKLTWDRYGFQLTYSQALDLLR